MPRRSIQPAAQQPVIVDQFFSTPWFRFLLDLNDLAVNGGFASAVEFDSSSDTDILGTAKVYRFTGSGAVTLTLTDRLLDLGALKSLWVFQVKDEVGVAGTNPITIDAGGSTIDGAASIQIIANFGSVTIYSNGAAFFTL